MTIVYVTKYALTKKIYEVNAQEIRPGAYIYRPKGWLVDNYVFDHDVHITQAAALKRAETMRINKIASLEKQIKRLRNMAFEVEQN